MRPERSDLSVTGTDESNDPAKMADVTTTKTTVNTTNISAHHHLYFEDSGILRDVAGDNVAIGELPALPESAKISRIDIIIRVKDCAPAA